MARWSDAELEATVAAYLEMLSLEGSGANYQKSAFRKRLLAGPLATRSAASVEYRMRNISAVLDAARRTWLPGYAPAANVGQKVQTRLHAIIEQLEAQQASASAVPPMIFFNIGWMASYAGLSSSDKTIGGHGWLADHEHGGEAFNFVPYQKRMYGCRPGESRGIELKRLGAQRRDQSLDGVLVIWMAREPATRQAYIVGWYQNATVHRQAQLAPAAANRMLAGEPLTYSAESAASDCRLLPVGARNFIVPSRNSVDGGFGQSPIWYGVDDAFRERVWRYVQRITAGAGTSKARIKAPSKSGSPRNTDPELRRKVEKAAVDHARRYYESMEGGGYKVHSVELDRVGWDLEAYGADEQLLIEVKGLSGSDLICELTPNEFSKFTCKDHRLRYVVYVVNNALTSPIASMFRYEPETDDWIAEDGRRLHVDPRLGARLSVAA